MTRRMYSWKDLMKIFEINHATVAIWTTKGLLPEPYRLGSEDGISVYWDADEVDRLKEAGLMRSTQGRPPREERIKQAQVVNAALINGAADREARRRRLIELQNQHIARMRKRMS